MPPLLTIFILWFPYHLASSSLKLWSLKSASLLAARPSELPYFLLGLFIVFYIVGHFHCQISSSFPSAPLSSKIHARFFWSSISLTTSSQSFSLVPLAYTHSTLALPRALPYSIHSLQISSTTPVVSILFWTRYLQPPYSPKLIYWLSYVLLAPSTQISPLQVQLLISLDTCSPTLNKATHFSPVAQATTSQPFALFFPLPTALWLICKACLCFLINPVPPSPPCFSTQDSSLVSCL